jgi:two-component system, cell cycle sensor histidine kinase and response regulator CckA
VADRGQLEQVLMNLALNARDAMPGGGELTIDVRNETSPPPSLDGEHFVCVKVGDCGRGMTPEVAARALEPFFTTKPSGQGTGLGLPSVYGIVTQAGGSIELDSTPGEGTCVTVWLPATTDAISPAGDVAPAPPPGRGQRVLVVEDQPAVREVTRRILTDHGYEVMTVEDAEQALLVVFDDRVAPEVLVTDVLMPGLSGAELVERVRARVPSMPVVYVSGFAEEGRTAGGDAPTLFVEKPFRAADLLTAVADALRGA